VAGARAGDTGRSTRKDPGSIGRPVMRQEQVTGAGRAVDVAISVLAADDGAACRRAEVFDMSDTALPVLAGAQRPMSRA
jgi:hypothetical protein